MKGRDDFRRALGEPDAAFTERVRATLASLPEEEEVKVKKVHRPIILAAALLVALAAALAETNFLGFRDFMDHALRGDRRLQQAVTELTQTDIKLQNNRMERVNVRMREVIYEGGSLFAVVEVLSSDDKVLLAEPLSNGDALGCMLFANENGEVWEERTSVKEYAAKNGFERIMYVNLTIDPMSPHPGGSSAYHIAGGILTCLEVQGLSGAETLDMTLAVTLYDEGWNVLERRDMPFTVRRDSAGDKEYASDAPVEVAPGVTLISLRARQTALGVRVTAVCTSNDEEIAGICFLDEKGSVIGNWGNGIGRQLDENTFEQTQTLRLLVNDLDALTIRVEKMNSDENAAAIAIPLRRIN